MTVLLGSYTVSTTPFELEHGAAALAAALRRRACARALERAALVQLAPGVRFAFAVDKNVYRISRPVGESAPGTPIFIGRGL